MKIYIYSLIDPVTSQIRYIGKTKNNLKKRLYEHCTIRNLIAHTYKNFWIKSLLLINLKPIISLIEITDELNWKEREIFWIKYYRQNFNIKLTNSTDGGEGAIISRLTSEQIQKGIATRRKNDTLKRTDATKSKISNSRKGINTRTNIQVEEVANLLRKPIIQYSLDGEYLTLWKGVRFCADTLKIDRHGVISCLKGERPNYKGFIWKYQSA